MLRDEEGDLQDGMLIHYNRAAPQTPEAVEREVEKNPGFDWREFVDKFVGLYPPSGRADR
jgi:predicted metal-dependent peptidase